MKLERIALSTLKGKRVLLRVDVNVPVEAGVPEASSERLSDALSTIGALQKEGARVIVMAHRGRPDGIDPAFTLEPIAEHLVRQLPPGTGRFVGASSYEEVLAETKLMADGDVLFLENLRFHPGERANDPIFAAQLADLGDVYMNDAFANSHRDHASMTGIAAYIDAYAGPNVLDEIEKLEPVRHPKKRPCVAIVGGSKIASKLHALEALLKKADHVFVGGALATAFFVAQEKPVGVSYYHKEDIEHARHLLQYDALELPVDVAVRSPRGVYARRSDEVRPDEAIEDIGPLAIKEIRAACLKGQTLMWNGPLGIIEEPQTRVGSDAVAHIFAEVSRGTAYGVIGGGDTIGIPHELGLADLIDHVSTGGSAMLEYIGEQVLPGLEVLKQKA